MQASSPRAAAKRELCAAAFSVQCNKTATELQMIQLVYSCWTLPVSLGEARCPNKPLDCSNKQACPGALRFSRSYAGRPEVCSLLFGSLLFSLSLKTKGGKKRLMSVAFKQFRSDCQQRKPESCSSDFCCCLTEGLKARIPSVPSI